jgi:hypothetical protein
MKTRRRTPSQRLAAQAVELSLAAPQVVALRVARLARAGAAPSAADRREFHRMGAEKVAAFWQSWFAMGIAAWQQPWQFWAGIWAWPAAGGRGPSAAAGWLTEAAGRVLAAGLAPVHGRAVANARRLGRHRSR